MPKAFLSAKPLPRIVLAGLLLLAMAAPSPAQGSQDGIPAYTPVTARPITAVQLLAKEARWIRNQVWATGPVDDASTFLFPRSYDVTSGYGFLGTDYYTWMIGNNASYRQYEADHNDHKADVPTDHSDDATIERIMTAWGANSYDMASWSIALAAATRNRNFSREEKADFSDALAAYHRYLVTASYPGGFLGYQAYDYTGSNRWSYGESGQDAAHGTDAQGRPLDARNAYYWQFPAPKWQNPDPHWDPLGAPGAVMNWPDWDVITGEEAWAAFLGPMQTAYAQGAGQPGWAARPGPIDARALVENACRALWGVELMQNSVTGGLYRNVRPPASADDPRWFDLSMENNWSMYTGLGFLESALLDLKANGGAGPDLDVDQSLATVQRIRGRMRTFFLDGQLVWHAKGQPFGDPDAVPYGFVLQGTTGRAGAAIGNTAAFATDAQTWGIAAILRDRELEGQMAASYGPDFLYDMFNAAVGLGGYRPGGGAVLAGIGFNAQKAGDPAAQMSGEWTWGAINAAILLAEYYQEPAHADPARAEELLAQAKAMIAGVNQYCSHDYNPQALGNGRDWVGYLYANARQWIPWGWFSNACPSQAATTWAMRVNAGFNAFELGGGDHQATVLALGLAGGQEVGPAQ